MASSGSDSNSSEVSSFKVGIDEERNPLWKCASKIQKLVNAGDNWAWTCKFCGIAHRSCYTRLRAHLLKISGKGISVCNYVSDETIVVLKKLEDESLMNLESSKSKADLVLGSAPCIPTPPLYPKVLSQDTSKRRRCELTTDKAFDLQRKNQLDAQIARMFYSSGLPFNVARNPDFVNSFSFATMGSYVPPGPKELRTTLLQQEKMRVDKLLERIRNSWSSNGVSIVSDGWNDPQHSPIINFMAVSINGPMFIKSHDCSGAIKDEHFIAAKLEDVINEIGAHNVVQIITDNGANCKAAGKIIEDKFPHIFWTPCAVHTLNLALNDICTAKNNQEVYEEFRWITEVHDNVLLIKNFLLNHQMRSDIFNRFSSLKLLAVPDTRFATVVVTLKRFKRLRRSLEAMVISDEWKKYKEVDFKTAQTLRALVLDEGLWETIDCINTITSPIYDMLRAFDTDKPCLHLVYDMWDSMIGKVKKVVDTHEVLSCFQVSSLYDTIHDILVTRFVEICSPLHCLAHSLNPRCYSEKWLEEKEERMQPPHMDSEVSSRRTKCFRRLFPREDEFNAVIAEYAAFSLKSGYFADSDSIDLRHQLEPMAWWTNFGAGAPILQTLAIKLLGHPSSASCCERNWSTYSFVHSLKKNKLTSKQAEDLIFVHNNLRLLSRSSDEYQSGESKMWDVGGDAFESMGDVGILEVANLTLDEPEFEYEFFGV